MTTWAFHDTFVNRRNSLSRQLPQTSEILHEGWNEWNQMNGMEGQHEDEEENAKKKPACERYGTRWITVLLLLQTVLGKTSEDTMQAINLLLSAHLL